MPPKRLREYEQKREFEGTPEPLPGEAAATDGHRFVVHEHSARRWHLDLRLEHDGALASFALPNGLPDDPAQNRKAVHTEDHPIEYLGFHGRIPEGHYGAGSVDIWDEGTYSAESWDPRKIVVRLDGRRAHGRYALFHVGPDAKDWMIHRTDPPDPGREPMPTHLVPMRARAGRLPSDPDGYACEVCWSGERALAHLTPGRVRFESSTLEDVTARYPGLRRLGRAIGARSALLDGVVVALDERGRPDRELLARHPDGPAVRYMIFDLIHLDGQSLLEMPQRERRARLQGLGLEGPAWSVPETFEAGGEPLLAAAREQGLPGIVAKRLDAPYRPGVPSDAWIAVAARHPRRKRGRESATLAELLEGGRPLGEGRVEVELGGRRLTLSNLDKVLWPATGTTKGDLIDYVLRLSQTVLPHLYGRPLTLKRYPDGVTGAKFFEKRCPGHRPAWVRTEAIQSERHGGPIDYCVVCDRPTLVWLANLACIELHVDLFLMGTGQRPTATVFDLDPGPGSDIVDCCRVAQVLRGMLARVGLESFPKTSGSKGLQVYVPLNDGRATFERTKSFARTVAELFEREAPDLVVARMTKSLRPGKVLIDWSQNDPRKSTICAYSPRGRDEPTVSTPVRWEEVDRCIERGDAGLLRFTTADVVRRADRDGDPFAGVLSVVQRLP
jgi:bifunctional non-homologous end joining protein LigD